MPRHSFRLISGRHLQHSGTGMTKQKNMLKKYFQGGGFIGMALYESLCDIVEWQG